MNSTRIDVNQFHDHSLHFVKQLKKFTFYTETSLANSDHSVTPSSNEDLRRGFIGRNYQQIASFVRPKSAPYFSDKCVIYTLPFEFEYFFGLDNSFRSDHFHRARRLKMSDRTPFQCPLFRLIAQDFPFLQSLLVTDECLWEVDEDSLTLITFPYLASLNLQWSHPPSHPQVYRVYSFTASNGNRSWQWQWISQTVQIYSFSIKAKSSSSSVVCSSWELSSLFSFAMHYSHKNRTISLIKPLVSNSETLQWSQFREKKEKLCVCVFCIYLFFLKTDDGCERGPPAVECVTTVFQPIDFL